MTDSQKTDNQSPSANTVSSLSAKEQEAITISSGEKMGEVPLEVEIPPEVERVGVRKVEETFELPPDMKKLQVTAVGQTTPFTTVTTNLPQVVLPITDKQVLEGLHTKMTNAIKWLAFWCIRKLKKAHIAIKEIHGKIIRVKN